MVTQQTNDLAPTMEVRCFLIGASDVFFCSEMFFGHSTLGVFVRASFKDLCGVIFAISGVSIFEFCRHLCFSRRVIRFCRWIVLGSFDLPFFVLVWGPPRHNASVLVVTLVLRIVRV